MAKQLLVYGDKTFKVTIPDDAKVTFGPWSPPNAKQRDFGDEGRKAGTLRIYQGTKENIIACFSGVRGFRDLTMQYAEQIAVEEGATVWKDDNEGYVREQKVSRKNEWIDDPLKALPAPKKSKRK